MKKRINSIMQMANKVVKEQVNYWELVNSVKDSIILDDIKAAIMGAYIEGVSVE